MNAKLILALALSFLSFCNGAADRQANPRLAPGAAFLRLSAAN
jgi:hypothetical protein